MAMIARAVHNRKTSYLQNRGSFLLESKTMDLISIFFENRKKQPDKTIIIHGEKDATFLDLDLMSSKFAGWLKENGAGPGSTVALLHQDSLESAVVYLAAWRTGVKVLALDDSFSIQALVTLLTDSKARWLVSSSSHYDLLNTLSLKVPSLNRTVLVDKQFDDGRSVSLKNILSGYPALPIHERSSESPVHIIYRAGSEECRTLEDFDKLVFDFQELIDSASRLLHEISKTVGENNLPIITLTPSIFPEGVITRIVLPLVFSRPVIIPAEVRIETLKDHQIITGREKELSSFLEGKEESPFALSKRIIVCCFDWPRISISFLH